MFAFQNINHPDLISKIGANRISTRDAGGMYYVPAAFWNLLPLKCCKVLALRFGIQPFNNKGMSYRKVAEKLGYSDRYVADLESTAIERLRELFKSETYAYPQAVSPLQWHLGNRDLWSLIQGHHLNKGFIQRNAQGLSLWLSKEFASVNSRNSAAMLSQYQVQSKYLFNKGISVEKIAAELQVPIQLVARALGTCYIFAE